MLFSNPTVLSPIHNWVWISRSSFFSPYSVHFKYFYHFITILSVAISSMATLTVRTVRWSHSSSPFCCYSSVLFLATGLDWIIISGWKFLPWQRAADSEQLAPGCYMAIPTLDTFLLLATAQNCNGSTDQILLTKSDRPTSLAEPDFQDNIWSVWHT